MRLLIMGAPGSGKGSQSEVLSRELRVPAISTGDLFRAHARDRTPLGVEVEAILRAGDYVPDGLTNRMVRERLMLPDASDGFILDGYPRTSDQVTELDDILDAAHSSIDAVVQLVVPVESLIARLTSRGVTDGRDDDTIDAIRHRLSVFDSVTAPLLDIYDRRGVLVSVSGVGTPSVVTERILDALRQVVRR